METEVGKVVATRPGRARVEVKPSSLCGHCQMASSCGQESSGGRVIEAADPLGVSVDQRVRIEMSSGGLIGASLLAYIVPLITLFAGVLLGYNLANGARPEIWSGLGALAGLILGVVISRLAADWLGRRGKLTPTITAVVEGDGDLKECPHEN
jgi:sigma-E factor negative regulatory protein RseC